MTPQYPTMLVAAGRDPSEVISEVMLHRYPGSDEYIYHPGVPTPGRVVVGGSENLTSVNHEWLQRWHQENSEYSLRSPYHRKKSFDPDYFGDRPAIAMPSVDDIADHHHEISADVIHNPTQKKVGDFHFTLGSWPELPKGKNIATAHIWSFYRHKKPYDGDYDPHHGVMTSVLDSWLGHAKKAGIRHGFIQGDASKGYWLKNITRHPDMVWGSVEYDADKGRTRQADHMDARKVATLKSHPDLFAGWPGTRLIRARAVGESLDETDAFVMRWNQEHPKPSHVGGPIPTHLMRFDKGRMKSYPGHLDKACYFHALRLAKKNPNMKLAVGFVAFKDDVDAYEKGGPTPLLFTHAFNITKRGEIHDPSLGSDRSVNNRYYGHVIENPHQFKTSSDLYNWVGYHYQTGHFRGAGGTHLGIQADIDHKKEESVLMDAEEDKYLQGTQEVVTTANLPVYSNEFHSHNQREQSKFADILGKQPQLSADHHKALEYWSQGGSAHINAFLQSGERSQNPHDDAERERHHKVLRSAIDKAQIPGGTPLYYGAQFAPKTVGSLKPGGVLTHKGLTSFSSDPSIAHQFAYGGMSNSMGIGGSDTPVVFRHEASAGDTGLAVPGSLHTEREVILPPSSFKILRVHKVTTRNFEGLVVHVKRVSRRQRD